ncbi:MAG TPA: SagB/ThcOx family dehydrogenase [Thermoanaerobaculia bacterium]|nr:SagB/ThcOx family dehydrogenase [Thermoanaerobaculia bacterium]
MNSIEPDLAGLYHLNSSSTRSKILEREQDPETRPASRRLYPGAERVRLPGRDFDLPLPLGDALERRSSRRDFRLAPLPLETLGRLLHASFGRNQRRSRPFPSAGGLYPLELYAITQQVEGLPDGIWHYDPWVHELALRRDGRFFDEASAIAYGQAVIRQANLLLCLSAVFERTAAKYGQRGYRYVLFEAGHVGQNLYLVADALGLAPFSIGGFFDHELDALLRLPSGEEEALYLFCAGQPASQLGGS